MTGLACQAYRFDRIDIFFFFFREKGVHKRSAFFVWMIAPVNFNIILLMS